MIIERPGASNDRDIIIGNLDQKIENKEEYDKNYNNCFGEFIPAWYRKTYDETGIPFSEALKNHKFKP